MDKMNNIAELAKTLHALAELEFHKSDRDLLKYGMMPDKPTLVCPTNDIGRSYADEIIKDLNAAIEPVRVKWMKKLAEEINQA